MQRTLMILCMVIAGFGVALSAQPANACPMCKIAHEDSTDPAVAARPRAYMYSIFFMLTMPATIVTSIGVSLYRMTKQEEAGLASMDQ